jgi:SOS-response transcriptional repressor LexA
MINTDTYLDLNAYLLGSNLDNILLVNIEEDSTDFHAGDMLVVNVSLKPKTGDFVFILEDETDERFIERFDIESSKVFGVVTATIRSL